jgi:hypothetical protein
MMSLLMAGRHPDRFAGAVSWVPIYDLRDWYRVNLEKDPRPDYVTQIEASCGGPPVDDSAAAQECRSRSPVAYLDAAREADIPVYIGAGLSDENVPPSNAVEAFNQLAALEDRFPPAQVDAIGMGTLPEELEGQLDAESFFGPEDPEVLLTRRSGQVTLVIFAGGHDMVYNPGLLWMARGAPSGG